MSMVHSSIALEVIAMDWPVLRMKATGYYLAQCAQNKTFSKLNTKLMAINIHACHCSYNNMYTRINI